MDGYIGLSPLAVEHSVVAMSAGFQSRLNPRLNPVGILFSIPENPIFNSSLMKFVFRIIGA